MAFHPGPEYLGLPRSPNSWIIEHILPTSGLLNIFGPPKSGKTYATLELALNVSDPTKTHWFNWPIKTHGPVWYLQLDTPRVLFSERYLESAIAVGHNINEIAVADAQEVPYPFNILGDGKGWLRDQIAGAANPPIALVIDTLRDAHGADENDSGVMRNVITSFVDAVMPGVTGGWVQPALVFLSHQKKLNADQPIDLMSGNRGSSYVAGRMDCVFRVAGAEFRVQSRTMEETVVGDYRRTSRGFWVKFNENVELTKFLIMDFKSSHARHEAFALEWKISVACAQNWFKNLQERGSFDRYPEKKKTA